MTKARCISLKNSNIRNSEFVIFSALFSTVTCQFDKWSVKRATMSNGRDDNKTHFQVDTQ